MNTLDMVIQIELHSVEGINKCFSEGVSPNDKFRGEPLIYELISEYTRSPKFKDCVRAFVDHGLDFEDKILLSVLLDAAASLDDQIKNNPSAVFKKLRCVLPTLRCMKPVFCISVLNSTMFHVPKFLLSMG